MTFKIFFCILKILAKICIYDFPAYFSRSGRFHVISLRHVALAVRYCLKGWRPSYLLSIMLPSHSKIFLVSCRPFRRFHSTRRAISCSRKIRNDSMYQWLALGTFSLLTKQNEQTLHIPPLAFIRNAIALYEYAGHSHKMSVWLRAQFWYSSCVDPFLLPHPFYCTL